MGNCQAIDNATLAIQHPNGRVDNLYHPVSATEVMKMNPGHYVALLLTTTLYSSTAAAASAAAAAAAAAASASKNSSTTNYNNTPLRITRIKLLRPTDTLVLGHVYRLVTTQEVMKGLWAKKQSKMNQQQPGYAEKYGKIITDKLSSDFEAVIKKTDVEKTKQVKHESKHRSRNNTAVKATKSAESKSRSWQPSLKSISEAAS